MVVQSMACLVHGLVSPQIYRASNTGRYTDSIDNYNDYQERFVSRASPYSTEGVLVKQID